MLFSLVLMVPRFDDTIFTSAFSAERRSLIAFNATPSTPLPAIRAILRPLIVFLIVNSILKACDLSVAELTDIG
ncbi:hypothetical protein D3C78_1607970 [compost metagenome]